MYEVMQSDSAHNGEALFHADKYIYTRNIYIKRNLWNNIYKEPYIHESVYM